MKTLLNNDFLFLKKTSKLIIFPVLFIVFSIISPVTAKYLGEILSSILSSGEMSIVIPEPTVISSYQQYLSDLNEIILFVIIFVGLGMFIRDKTKGILPLVLSKPINRKKYLMSKYISFSILVLISSLIGYVVFSYYTYLLFGQVFWGKGLVFILLYFLYIEFILSIALLASTLTKSYILGIVATFGGFILFGILGIFKDLIIFKYLPGVLMTNINNIIMGTEDILDVYLNSGVTFLLTIIIIIVSLLKFDSQDI